MTIPENNSLSETGNYWMEGRLQCLVSAGFKVTSDGIYIYTVIVDMDSVLCEVRNESLYTMRFISGLPSFGYQLLLQNLHTILV